MADRQVRTKPLRARDPRHIGAWQILGRLGSGSMGVVFLGQRDDGQLGAVKVIAELIAHDETFRARFGREVKVLERVGGQYVASVIDADAWAEPPYLVTEYVDGTPLSRLIDTSGPLPRPAWGELASGMLTALVRVHAAGVIHRDIKPENILMADGRPWLIDFGVAAVQDGMQLTGTRVLVGTFGWMAPERIRGESASPATDMFSLGAVLAFAGTGNPPFAAVDPIGALTSVLAGEPDLAGLDADQTALVLAMLAEEPASRPSAQQALAVWRRAGRGR